MAISYDELTDLYSRGNFLEALRRSEPTAKRLAQAELRYRLIVARCLLHAGQVDLANSAISLDVGSADAALHSRIEVAVGLIAKPTSPRLQ